METVQDGWDEDDDQLEDVVQSPQQSMAAASGHSFAAWDFDDDPISESSETSSTTPVRRTSSTAQESSTTNPSRPLGLLLHKSSFESNEDDNVGVWEDDADLGLDDDALESIPASTARTVPGSRQPNGWNDEDLDFDDDLSVEVFEPSTLTAVEETAEEQGVEEQDGWEDDFGDLEVDDIQRDGEHALQPMTFPHKQSSKLYTELEMYLDQLGHLRSSINVVMQHEYNTLEKAQELLQYYSERPGLVAYTIKKELPRMEYSIIVSPGTPAATDKAVVAEILSQDTKTLMSRCANQSLLADVLQVLTGPDMLVRPQYHSAAIAQTCRFLLDYATSVVQAEATLDLSLPTQQRRWKVAEIDVRISFGLAKNEQFVDYSVAAIRPTPRDQQWLESLQSAADLLQSLPPDEVVFGDMPLTNVNNPRQDFRDVFLQQSQNLLENSKVGMKSAWQDIESVTGIGSKFKKIPAFLPDDVIQAAEQDPISPPKARPTSILGGLVRTGFSRLAQSVALPDEDPSLYQDWQVQSGTDRRTKQRAPPLSATHRPPGDGDRPSSASFQHHPVPQLYQRPDESERSHINEQRRIHPPTLSLPKGRPRTPLPPPGPPKKTTDIEGASTVLPSTDTTLPRLLPAAVASREHHHPHQRHELTSKNLTTEDGWGDDDDDDYLLFEDPGEAVSHPSPQSLKVNKSLAEPLQELSSATAVENDDWLYNPEDDIIPTRKRWVNPRPWMRQLSV